LKKRFLLCVSLLLFRSFSSGTLEVEMYNRRFRGKTVILIILVLFFLEILSGSDFVKVESWTHVVVAENYTDADGYSVYRIDDSRFNENDWYDLWMDNSYWGKSGWCSFDSVFDSGAGRMYFQPLYNDGYVEWDSFTSTDILGATLRFYRQY